MVALAAVLVAPRRLELQEFAVPDAADDDGILSVEACGLCGTDYEQWIGEFDFNNGKPLIPGHEIMGRVGAIGDAARSRWGIAEGDRIAVEGTIPCGTCKWCLTGVYKQCGKQAYGLRVGVDVPPSLWGGYATHMYLHPRAVVHRLPSDIPTDVMSLFNPLSNAVRWTCEVGGVGLGSSVVICGPGQRGLLAVLAAADAGAQQIIVTGTKLDHARLAQAIALGATSVIDIDEQDPIAAVRQLTSGNLVDVVVDVTNGANSPIVQAVEMIRPGGKIVLAGLKGRHPIEGLLTDRIVVKEIQVLGVMSAGWTSVELAIRIIERRRDLLARLKPKAFALEDVTTAVRTLGREIVDPDVLHLHLAMNAQVQ
jgi:threonine dehydrogenase-like Zn-dependent dehydrogenase